MAPLAKMVPDPCTNLSHRNKSKRLDILLNHLKNCAQFWPTRLDSLLFNFIVATPLSPSLENNFTNQDL